MVDTLRYKDWIEKAERDIKSAKILKEHDCGNDVVAFHCQQFRLDPRSGSAKNNNCFHIMPSVKC